MPLGLLPNDQPFERCTFDMTDCGCGADHRVCSQSQSTYRICVIVGNNFKDGFRQQSAAFGIQRGVLAINVVVALQTGCESKLSRSEGLFFNDFSKALFAHI